MWEDSSVGGQEGQPAPKVIRCVQVPALHIEDQSRTVHVRHFELAKPPAITQLEGDSTYVQPLLHIPGQSAQRWKEVQCRDIICVVDMLYHSEHQVWTLAEYDHRGMADWLSDMLQREAEEASRPPARAAKPVLSARVSPHPKAGPANSKSKQAQKAVRRSARLVGKYQSL